VHNFFPRVNRRTGALSTSRDVVTSVTWFCVKHAEVFFCFSLRNRDFIDVSRISHKEAQEIPELRKRSDSAPLLQTSPAPDNAAGGGPYTQN